jgi:hypothetical protein
VLLGSVTEAENGAGAFSTKGVPATAVFEKSPGAAIGIAIATGLLSFALELELLIGAARCEHAARPVSATTANASKLARTRFEY